jgi:hypothetical protein
VYVVGDAGAPGASRVGDSLIVAAVQKEYARVVVVLTKWSLVLS